MEKQLYKTANKTTTFIIESQFGKSIERKDGKQTEINKLLYTVVKRDESNKAVQTLKFWQDLPSAFYMFRLIDAGVLTAMKKDDESQPRMKHREFKHTDTKDRAFSVEPVNLGEKGIRVRFRVDEMESGNKENKQSLYFDMEPLAAKV